MRDLVTTHMSIYVAICVCTLLLFPFKVTAATCSETGHSDRNGDTPIVMDSGDPGTPLRCYLDSPNAYFRIYFNECDNTGCVDEQIEEENVEPMGEFLECARHLFLSPNMSPVELIFEDPIDSPWVLNLNDPATEDDDHIPVWINKESEGGGANQSPRLSFPAHGRLYDVVTPNAIHEFAHLFAYSYSDYLLHRAGFVNEGLPTFYERVFREPNSIRYSDICYDENRFLDLASESIRTKEYCEAARFWHFLSRFGSLEDPPEFYDYAQLIQACRTYSHRLDAVMLDEPPYTRKYPTDFQMRRIPGRDIIKAFYDRAAECFSNHRQTPACSENSGFSARCSFPRYPAFGSQTTCQPDDGYLNDLFADELYGMTYTEATTDPNATSEEINARKKEIKIQRRRARGVLMMPWILDTVDYAALTTWPSDAPADPRSDDGIAHFMFRRFLEWNYGQLQESASGYPSNSVDSDSEGFYIHAFGAHYHQFDLSTASARIVLRKQDDLPEWAYAAFYIDDGPTGRTLSPVSNFTGPQHSITSGWRNQDYDEVNIPLHADFDKAAVIVTAFGGDFDPTTISEMGHYQLRRVEGQFESPGVGEFWPPRTIPWPYDPFPWEFGKAPLPPGVRPPPWGFRKYPGYPLYGTGYWYRYFTPSGTDYLDSPYYSSVGSARRYRYAWPSSRGWGGYGYRRHGTSRWPRYAPWGYLSPWGRENTVPNYSER